MLSATTSILYLEAKDIVVIDGRPARQLAHDGDHRAGLLKPWRVVDVAQRVRAAPPMVRLRVQRVH
jgi:hypothetical protein